MSEKEETKRLRVYSKEDIRKELRKREISYRITKDEVTIYTYDSLAELLTGEPDILFNITDEETLGLFRELLFDDILRIRINAAFVLTISIEVAVYREILKEEFIQNIRNNFKRVIERDKSYTLRALTAYYTRNLEIIEGVDLIELFTIALKHEKDPKIKIDLAFVFARLMEDQLGEGTRVLSEIRDTYELDEIEEMTYEHIEEYIRFRKSRKKTEDGISEVRKSIKEEEPKEVILAKMDLLEKQLVEIEGRFEKQETSYEDLIETVAKMKGIFGKKEGDLLLDWGSLSKEIAMNTERIAKTEESLKGRIEDSHKLMRNALIVFSIIFSIITLILSGLTGWFISLLIKILESLSS